MELVLNKNWGEHKKGDKITILDNSVIEKGYEVGLFEKTKKEVKSTKEEK